jgi:hypothetical protein
VQPRRTVDWRKEKGRKMNWRGSRKRKCLEED